MALGLSTPKLNNGENDLTPQQQRGVELEQGIACLNTVESKLDQVSQDCHALDKYPKEIQEVLKDALAKEIYLQHGANAEISSTIGEGISPTTKEPHLGVNIGDFLYASVNPNKVIEDYANAHPNFDVEGLKQNLAEHATQIALEKQFNLEKDTLLKAINSASNERSINIQQRDADIKEIKSGFLGFFKKAPEALPSVESSPLTKEEILKYVDPKIAGNESFQKMLNDEVTANQKQLDSMGAINEKPSSGSFLDTLSKSIQYQQAAKLKIGEQVASFSEGTAGMIANTGVGFASGIGAIGQGAMQFSYDGDIHHSVEVMKQVHDTLYDQYKYQLSAPSQVVLDNSPLMQEVNFALQNTLGAGIQWAHKTLPEDVNFYVGAIGTVALDVLPSGRPFKTGIKSSLTNTTEYLVHTRKLDNSLSIHPKNYDITSVEYGNLKLSMGKTPSYDANHATDYLKKAIPEPPYKALAQSEIPKFIASLKDTANFQPNALEHILNGNFNRRGSAGGFHTESFDNSAGKVINGTRTPTDQLGLYQGQVEVNGVLKSGNGGFSTFFPKDWSPQRIVDEINHAYNNRNLKPGSVSTYRGLSSTGFPIDMYLDKNKKIISAFPDQ